MKKLDIRLFFILLFFGTSPVKSDTSEKESNTLPVEENLSREEVRSLTSSEVCQEPDLCPEDEALRSNNDGILNKIYYSWKRFQTKFKLWSWHDTVIVMIVSCSIDGCTLTLCYISGLIRRKYKARKQKRSLEMTRLQRKNRVFTKEYDPEKRRQLLIEATDLKPWRLKLKKKRRGKDS